MVRLFLRSVFLASTLAVSCAAAARGETVVLPTTLGYPMLRTLFLDQAYAGPGRVAVVMDESDGCYRIELREPEMGPEGKNLRLGSKIKIRAGIPIAGECLNPIEWEGIVELVEQPSIDKKKWLLSFETVSSRLLDSDRKPVQIASKLWDLVKANVHPYFARVHMDLGPPVQEVRGLLPLFFEPESRGRVERWLASIRPGTVEVGQDGMRANILMDVEEAPGATDGEGEPITLSDEQRIRFVQTWETLDSFLVYEILSMGAPSLTDGERQAFLETLLETRYRFVQEITAPTPDRDLVREQFVLAWSRLAPIFRKHLLEDPSRPPLVYLGFFAASDALAALDKLGPTLGIEISRDGLLRLATLLSQEGGEGAPSLQYSYAVDGNLRNALGMGPALSVPGPAFLAEELDLSAPGAAGQESLPPAGPTSFWRGLLVGTAWAAMEAPPPNVNEIKPWLIPADDPGPYLERLKGILAESAESATRKGGLDPQYRALFQLAVQATAWQESCWSQFVQKGGKVTYLRSYNNTSVGLMQINERVWRGVYSQPSLRWNVPYNALAGCEILEEYLRRSALARMDAKRPLEPDLLVRVLYAMYNGGPGQFEGFLKRHAAKSYNLSDRLFAEKYSWVKNARWGEIKGCLPVH